MSAEIPPSVIRRAMEKRSQAVEPNPWRDSDLLLTVALVSAAASFLIGIIVKGLMI